MTMRKTRGLVAGLTVGFALLLVGCGGGGGGSALQGHATPQDFLSVQDFLSHPLVQQLLARGNLTVHTGLNPPSVGGRYDATEVIQIDDFNPGAVGLSQSFDLTLFDQTGDAISVDRGGAVFLDVFITGSGNNFTIWGVAGDALPGIDCTVVEVDIVTGRVLPNGALDVRFGAILMGLLGTDCAALFGDPDTLLGSIIVSEGTAAPRVWTPTSTSGAPEARVEHTAVWTGTEMIVWGGHDGDSIAKNTGGRFDPVTNTWLPMTTSGAPSARFSHTALWTGSEMIVWGGSGSGPSFVHLSDGARYDPQTDRWTRMSSVNAPSARKGSSSVWTGSEMIVWGGEAGLPLAVRTGARYDPVADTWTPIQTVGAPSARSVHSAVWSGAKMTIWGGVESSHSTETGGIYDLATDSWRATNSTGAPSPRGRHLAFWTGSRMIVFGGGFVSGSAGSLPTGGSYDPLVDSWTSTSTDGAPFTTGSHLMPGVWTGTELIAWSGAGARYDPNSNSWTSVSRWSPLESKRNHTAVWTGSLMIVWGGDIGRLGFVSGPVQDTGGIYDPRAD